MKQLLLLVSLVLSSCIWVDDLGEYWQKGEVDPALEGRWQVMSEQPGQGAQGNVSFTSNGKEYLFKEEGGQGSAAIVTVRSVKAGLYHYLMTRKEEPGQKPAQGLVRYQVEGDTLTVYEPHTLNVKHWLELKHPETTAFRLGKDAPRGFISAPSLNEEALSLLDSVPDEESYWKRVTLRKAK